MECVQMESLESTNERCAQLESNLKDLLQIKFNLEFRNTQLHNSVQQLREELDEKSNKLQQAEVALAQATAAATALTPTAERSSASTSPAPLGASLGASGAPTAADHDLLMRKYKKVKRMLQEYRKQHANAPLNDGSLNRNSSLGAGDRPDSYSAATGDTPTEDPLSVAVLDNYIYSRTSL